MRLLNSRTIYYWPLKMHTSMYFIAERKHESIVPNPVAPPAMSASSSASTLPPSDVPAPSTSATIESASGKKFRPGTSKNGRCVTCQKAVARVDLDLGHTGG